MAARSLAALAVFDFVHRDRANVAPVVELCALALLVREINDQSLQIGNSRLTITDDLDRTISQLLVLKECSPSPVGGDRDQLAGFCLQYCLKFHFFGNFDASPFESILQKHDLAGEQFPSRLDLLRRLLG